MRPKQQGVAIFHYETHLLTHGQAQFGRHMTKRQIRQHGGFDLRAQPIHDALQLEAFVMRGEFVVGELPQDNGFLLGQYASVQQLRQHAFDAVRVLCHIF